VTRAWGRRPLAQASKSAGAGSRPARPPAAAAPKRHPTHNPPGADGGNRGTRSMHVWG
jgi:hypothetical protein